MSPDPLDPKALLDYVQVSRFELKRLCNAGGEQLRLLLTPKAMDCVEAFLGSTGSGPSYGFTRFPSPTWYEQQSAELMGMPVFVRTDLKEDAKMECLEPGLPLNHGLKGGSDVF